MGKNELDEDLLVSGEISSESKNKKVKDKEKAEKKAEKAKAAMKKKAEKLSAKKEQLEKELETCQDDKKKAKLAASIKELKTEINTLSAGKKLSMPKNTVRVIRTAVIVVVVVALLAAYVATGTVRKGFVSYLNIPQNTFTGLVINDKKDDKKIKIKVGTYNYYYATTYNSLKNQQSQYQQYNIDLDQVNLNVDFEKPLSKQYTKNDDGKKVTWQEYIHEEVIESILSTYTYYYEALKANDGKEPEITDDQKSELKDTLSQYESSAKTYGYTLSGYLVKAMGKGVTSTLMRKEMTISYISQNYKDSLSDKTSKTEYTDKDYNNYKKEHNDDLISVNARIFECASEDDAKAFYKALKSDGSNFTALAGKYAANLDNGTFYKTAYGEDAGYSTENYVTKSILKNKKYAIATADSKDSKKYPGLDWLYSSSRKAGDAKQYSTTVVYVTKPVSLSNVKTVNVRHILIEPETSSSSSSSQTTAAQSATAAQWKTAYEKAQSVLKEWKKGKATEDTFSTLAKSNSADSNKDDGGLYENVYPGQMVNSFSSWCFDSSRKAGDTAIVKTDYGYHIMYFVKSTNMEAWKYTAQQALASDDSESNTDKIEKSYTIDENWFGSRYFEIDTDIDN